MTFQVHNEDCLAGMAKLAENSVDSFVTDPPYGLSFMGKGWDHGIPGMEFWQAALRIAKPGTYLLAFGGTRTYHRLACAIEDAGWEIRDSLMWCYGSGFPKSLNLTGERKGWGTALKPAFEPIILARKPLIGTVAANVQEFGTGAMNIDGCRVPINDDDAYAKNCSGDRGHDGTRSIDKRGTTDLRPGGGTAADGRWPANLIHDGSDEVLELFPQNAGASAKVRGDEPSNASNGNITGSRDRVPGAFHGDAGSAARFFYCAKASKADRDEGMEGAPERLMAASNQAQAQLKRGEGHKGTSGVNTIKVRKNNHPTVKPTALMRYLCKLITPPAGLILDPFTGSGSTGKAALLEGFRFVGFELEQPYAEIANARCAAVAKQTPLLEAAS